MQPICLSVNQPIRLSSQSHSQPCTCKRKVAEIPTGGVALWSAAPSAMGKLEAVRGVASPPSGPVHFTQLDWVESVEGFLSSLTPLERADVKAAPIGPDGQCQAWDAVPADIFLHRVKSPWLPRVLNERLLIPHYQPIVHMASGKTIAFEALMRAQIDGRLINGGELVDAARAHNAMFQFDQLARTCAISHGSTKLQPGELLFVNFTPMVIYDPAICLQTTWEAATAAGWLMEKLVFEVVESEAFPNIAHLRHILDTYRDHGCKVALDDLGTGHTALSYIDELRPDVIKLAKGLLPDRPRPHDLGLIRGLVEHAQSRNITTLIEGVETPEQLDAVHLLGIDLVQGYYLGKPTAEPVRVTRDRRKAA